MKAREFWITESRCTGKKLAHKTQLECWESLQGNDNEVHVIEYSAYLDILAHADRLAEALEQYADENNWTIDAVENGFGCDYGAKAKAALAAHEAMRKVGE